MLITIEGIDGSGKTTVTEALQDRYPDATITREPTATWYGDAVRRSITDAKADPLAELFLYTADHAAHLARTVRPAVDAGELVISDRYSDSRYAYQAASLAGVIEEPLSFVQTIHAPWTIPPDATVYLDIPAEVGAARSGATNKFESAEFLERVHQNYERLMGAEPDRFVRIDGEQPIPRVIEETEDAVTRILSSP